MPRSRRYPIPSLALAAALVAFAPAPARALHATGQPGPGSLQTTASGVSFSLGTSVGVVEGTASELAFYYPNGKKFKLSELTWDIKDVVMAGLHGSMGIGRRIRLNLGVWSALTEGNGTMVDRDWDYPASVSAFLEPNAGNWTHESQHPDTSLDSGVSFDTNANVMAIQAGPFSLHGILGVKRDDWQWSARGGTYIYSTLYPGSRDRTGAFPEGQQVISYEQKYLIPYLGVGANLTWPAFLIESHLLYGPAVSASDSDYHALRGVLFEGDYSGGTYVGLGLNATWAFAPRWSAAFGVEYQSIPELTGDVEVNDGEGPEYFRGGSGIALNATSVSLGASYRF